VCRSEANEGIRDWQNNGWTFPSDSYIDTGSGVNTYDAGDGLTYVYDQEWNWLGSTQTSSTFYYVVMSDNAEEL